MPDRESAAYLQAVLPHVVNQRSVQERTLAALKILVVENELSRRSTILTLRNIQAECGPIVFMLGQLRAPAALTQGNGYLSQSMRSFSAVVTGLADGLAADTSLRTQRLEQARAAARDAEASARHARDAFASALGTTAGSVPYVGTIIAAVLMVIAAVIILIGQIIAKDLEQQAEEKEKKRPPRP